MVELENITKVYRMRKVDVYTLNGVSLSIEKGEMTAITGASGSGKSTLLHIIGCLDKATSGKYTFEGADVSLLNDNQLAEMRNKKFGFVFQEYCYPALALCPMWRCLLSTVVAIAGANEQ